MNSDDQARELLVGAVDTHVHPPPTSCPGGSTTVRPRPQAAGAGMRRDRAEVPPHRDRRPRAARGARAGGRIAVRGGIALDDAVGGLNAAAVETSARLGGVIVWLPTTCSSTFVRWSAANAPGTRSARHRVGSRSSTARVGRCRRCSKCSTPSPLSGRSLRPATSAPMKSRSWWPKRAPAESTASS